MTTEPGTTKATEATVLVAGASGITGSYIERSLRALAVERPGLRVLSLSRQGSTDLNADLDDAASVAALADSLSQVTHVVYCAFAGGGGASTWGDLTERNTNMLSHLLEVIQDNDSLARVVLMQGQKYYGSHLGPYKTPTVETDARHAGDNFYFTQQDMLHERSGSRRWDYVCLRPHLVCGLNERAPQNPVAVLSQYAMLMKRTGKPLTWPGAAEAFGRITQATDADLLADATRWALFDDGVGGEAFNIINGDYFRWEQLWPVLAGVFEVPVGEINTRDLSAEMPALGQRHLPGHPEPDWAFANYMLSCSWDVMAGTLKAREFGYNGFCNSLARYESLFRQARGQLEAKS